MPLPNSDINGLPLTVPAAGMHGVLQGPDGITYRFLIDPFLVSQPPTNIEWLSDEVYDEDEIVTHSGQIWQSLIDDNENITPGSDESAWQLLTYGASLKKWEAAVYTEEEVIVFHEINGRLYWFMLKDDVTRPFVSSDFDTEHLAGTWIEMGRVDSIQVAAVGSNITWNMFNLAKMSFRMPVEIVANRNILITNDTLAEEIPLFRFSTDAAGRELQFENKVKMHKGLSGDGNWNDGTKKWISPEAGLYEGWGNYADGVWTLRIEGPF